jgi:hypothetical protein
MKRAMRQIFAFLIIISLCLPVVSATPVLAQEPEPSPDAVVQTAVIAEEYGYLNLSDRGGRPGGGGVDGDGPPPLQQASMTATFANFELNGISFEKWQGCRATGSVDDCLATLGTTLRQQHPGEIGGDTFAFDITITNTSDPGGPVLTTFAFQSKFSESPAMGSRIGDKLFTARCVVDPLTGPKCDIDTDADNPLIGVKKNGTTNGLFGGKIKGICINSSDDYPLRPEPGRRERNAGMHRRANLQPGDQLAGAASGGWILHRGRQHQAAQGPAAGRVDDHAPVAGCRHRRRRLAKRSYGRLDLIANPNERDSASAVGPLIGTLANLGQPIAANNAAACLELDVQPGDNVLEVVNFGDVKIIRDSFGNCVPSFEPFSKNQFLTVPRRNWGFTDILDTRDDYLSDPLPTVLTGDTGKFSFLDFDNLREGEMNFFEILRGFGEFGETLDPSCMSGGSKAGKCGGEAYVPWAEFYAIADGKLVRQEVVGSYGPANYTSGPSLTATIDTNGQTDLSWFAAGGKVQNHRPVRDPRPTQPGFGHRRQRHGILLGCRSDPGR